jgi:hypothetical protein
MTYEQYRKTTCEWCAKGNPRQEGGRFPFHYISPSSLNGYVDHELCTAPTIAEFAESESARADEMTAYAARQTDTALSAGERWTEEAGRADALREKCEALEADRKRLDWLETQNLNGKLYLYLGGPWLYNAETRETRGRWRFENRIDLGVHDTAREAIDAAMQAEATEEKRDA